jgi:glutathione S-transferase
MHYTGMDYEDEGYVQGPNSGWQEKKFKMDLEFPNLPYFIDGNLRLTQSNAILRHLGRVNNLYGVNANESSTIDMLIDTAGEMKMGLAMISYKPDFVRQNQFQNNNCQIHSF